MCPARHPPPPPLPTPPNRPGLGAGHARSVQRIITQNLVLSAIAAECGTGPTSMTAIGDLAALINLVVLYDELYVLGRGGKINLGPSSDLVDFLGDEHVIRAESFDLSTSDQVASAARHHLLHFLGSQDIEDTRDFKELLSYFLSPGVAYQYLMTPDDLARGHPPWRAVGPERPREARPPGGVEARRSHREPGGHVLCAHLPLSRIL